MVEPVGEEWLYPLMTWLSPAYPVGAFSYSHGLEWLVETGAVTDAAGLAGYVEAVLARGGGWTDLVLFAAAWRAGGAGGTPPPPTPPRRSRARRRPARAPGREG